MSKIATILICFIFCIQNTYTQEDFRKNAPAPGPAPKIEWGKARQLTLKNGLKIIVVEDRKLPTLSIRVFVDAPPILEGDQVGYVDMAGELLRMGTTTRTKSEIDETIDFLGATLVTNANGISGSCLAKHREDLLEIMADILFNPSFPEAEFEKLKKLKLSDLARTSDDANVISSNVSALLRNGKNHPYGEIETTQTIINTTLEKCKSYYETYFKPNISYIIITGDIESEEAMKLSSRYFSKWENKPVLRPQFPVPQKPEATLVDFVHKPGAVQSLINITYPVLLKPGTPDAVKAMVLNTLLGGFPGSRLNMNLREDKGYTYGARSTLSNDPLVGSFSAYASVRNEVTDSSIVQFLSEIKQLREEMVSEEELQMVKNVITGSFARALEDPETIAMYTLNTVRYGLPEDFYATYLEKLDKITPSDVLQAARTFLTPDQAHILIVGNKDEVSGKLLPFSQKGKINYYDNFGNIIEEINIPAPKDMTADRVLQQYLKAIGGVDQLNSIENVIIAMQSEIQNVSLETVLYHRAPNQLSMSNKMMGNIIQQTIYNGGTGIVINMGEVKPMDETKLKDMQVDSRLFPERFYRELGVQTKLQGIEYINGLKSYKVLITYPSGTQKTQFFDVGTSLKVREIEKEGDKTIINDIGNYKEVSGIQFPHTVKVSGAAPFTMTLETIAVEVNTEIDDALFKVN